VGLLDGDVVHRAGGPAGTGGDGRLVGVFD
jgi:hypothetical protein